jgi:hypothetical protein
MGSIEKIEKNIMYKLVSLEGLPLSVIFQMKLLLAFELTGTKDYTGNALAREHEPVDLWDITFLHPQILRLLVLLKPADFEAQSSLL